VEGWYSYVSFSLLINGSTTSFFYPSIGLMLGFPLSPLIFLIIFEGLSRFTLHEKNSRGLKGISMGNHIFLMHLRFVDDVLISSDGSLRDDD
jgi:hypothetical protein